MLSGLGLRGFGAALFSGLVGSRALANFGTAGATVTGPKVVCICSSRRISLASPFSLGSLAARVLAASLCASSTRMHQAMEVVVSFLKVRHKQVDGINSWHTASTLGVSVRTPGASNLCRESRLNSRDKQDEMTKFGRL